MGETLEISLCGEASRGANDHDQNAFGRNERRETFENSGRFRFSTEKSGLLSASERGASHARLRGFSVN
jgi:hypothetical protein